MLVDILSVVVKRGAWTFTNANIGFIIHKMMFIIVGGANWVISEKKPNKLTNLLVTFQVTMLT